MKSREPDDRSSIPQPDGPLSDLVTEKLNKTLADQIAQQLEENSEEPARSEVVDYAHGTVEHEDDPEA